MDPRLVLVTAISLLYNESRLSAKGSNSAGLVKDAVNLIRLPEIVSEIDKDREILVALRSTALWMVSNSQDHVYDKAHLLQRVRVNCNNDSNLFAAVESYVNDNGSAADDNPEKVIIDACLSLRQSLRSFIARTQIKKVLSDANREVAFSDGNIDEVELARKVMASLEPFGINLAEEIDPAVVAEIDFDDLESTKKIMRQAAAELSSDGVMRLGIHFFNNMFGENGGIRRGEFIVVGGLQHSFKSGTVNTWFKQIPLYNTPFMRDVTKKPLVLRISFENEATNDVLWLYKSLKENETGVKCDTKNISEEEAAAYLQKRLRVNGYHVKMVRIDPTDFTFYRLFDYLMRLEAEGYEIHFLVIDYLNMMSKNGCTQGPTGHDIRDLFRRVRNFTSKRGIACATPHQLSSEAKNLVKQNIENFVQEIANKGYYDGCRVIDQEVDVEIYVHKEKFNGEYFLTVQRGKHRGLANITPDKHLYGVLKFHEIGDIRDDINDKDLSMRYLGGSSLADGGAAPWNQFRAI